MSEENLTGEEAEHQEGDSNELEDRVREANFTLVKYISMHDIKRAGIVWRDLSQEDKDGCLWSAGLDVKGFRYITFKGEHVTMEGLRKDCVRFLCNERLDEEWIKGGHATEEAELTSKGDPSLSREIYKMKTQPLWDSQIGGLE